VDGRTQSRLVFGRSKTESELWVSIIEKGYAKLHSSYKATELGFVDNALVDLTGGVGSRIQLRSDHVQAQMPDRLFNKLLQWKAADFLLGAGSPGISDSRRSEWGIVENHAYSILDVRRVGSHRLIKLMNPWGKVEWNGEFGDDSDVWTTGGGGRLRSKLNHTPGQDGIFWMSFDEFVQHFELIYLCRFFEQPKWTAHDISYSSFEFRRGVNAGGCTNYASCSISPQYLLSVPVANRDVVLILTQQGHRAHDVVKIGIGAECYDHGGKRITQHSTGKLIADSQGDNDATAYRHDGEVVMEFTPKPNVVYTIIVSTFKPDKETGFKVRLYSRGGPVNFEPAYEGQQRFSTVATLNAIRRLSTIDRKQAAARHASAAENKLHVPGTAAAAAAAIATTAATAAKTAMQPYTMVGKLKTATTRAVDAKSGTPTAVVASRHSALSPAFLTNAAAALIATDETVAEFQSSATAASLDDKPNVLQFMSVGNVNAIADDVYFDDDDDADDDVSASEDDNADDAPLDYYADGRLVRLSGPSYAAVEDDKKEEELTAAAAIASFELNDVDDVDNEIEQFAYTDDDEDDKNEEDQLSEQEQPPEQGVNVVAVTATAATAATAVAVVNGDAFEYSDDNVDFNNVGAEQNNGTHVDKTTAFAPVADEAVSVPVSLQTATMNGDDNHEDPDSDSWFDDVKDKANAPSSRPRGTNKSQAALSILQLLHPRYE
jgi:hypothetical protein